MRVVWFRISLYILQRKKPQKYRSSDKTTCDPSVSFTENIIIFRLHLSRKGKNQIPVVLLQQRFCGTWSERGVFRDSDKEEKSTENLRQNVGKNYPQRKCHSISQNTDPCRGTWWLSFGQLKGLKVSRLTGGSITKALLLEENKYGSVGNLGKWPVKRKEGRKLQILHKQGKLPTSPSPSSIKYQ